MIYSTLENEIIPEYYDMDEQGVSASWAARMKNAINYIAPQFTMKRMMDDYHSQFYLKLAERHSQMAKNDRKKAGELSRWKAKVIGAWQEIEVVDRDIYNFANAPLPIGETLDASITLNLGSLSTDDIGVEMLIGERKENRIHIISHYEMEKQKVQKAVTAGNASDEIQQNIVKYICREKVTFSGVFEYGFRVYPYHPDLPHRMDFNLVSWI
jgi:hypothetical protein